MVGFWNTYIELFKFIEIIGITNNSNQYIICLSLILSTDKAIYHLANNILIGLDDNLLVGGIICDLTKAFGCVNHDIFLAKLDFYGITERANKLLISYLKTDIKQ
jgi:hypothetical protein